MNSIAQPRLFSQPPSLRILGVPILLHLLSLDAPIVAALWCWFFAAAFQIHIPVAAPVGLALGVWVLYIADRLLDARQQHSQSAATRLEARHLFHARHPRLMLACLLGATALLLWILLHYMPWFVFRTYLPIALLVPVYFLAVHFLPAAFSRFSLPTKEMAVGLFFAAATVTPTWARAQQLRAPLFCAAILFAALCTLNCIAIEQWESHPLSRDRLLPISLAVLSIAAAVALRFIPSAVAIAIIASCTLLFTLHIFRRRIPRLTLRVAADAVLLTPLLALLF